MYYNTYIKLAVVGVSVHYMTECHPPSQNVQPKNAPCDLRRSKMKELSEKKEGNLTYGCQRLVVITVN